jgi:hypothetical protein
MAAGYDAVRISDAEERALELLGIPDEIAPCGKQPYIRDDCESVLLYYTFLERSAIYVADDRKVINKIHNVSP